MIPKKINTKIIQNFYKKIIKTIKCKNKMKGINVSRKFLFFLLIIIFFCLKQKNNRLTY